LRNTAAASAVVARSRRFPQTALLRRLEKDQSGVTP
jgi:hypothetical protein